MTFTLLGLAISVWMALHSDGVYHDDDLTHMQIARWAWQYPRYFLDDWGRPGFTVPYALPAAIGWQAARVFSGILTAVTAYLAYLIAARQGIRGAALVPLLLWLQPLTFTLSYTTLTETPLALYFTLAMWLFLRGNVRSSAAIISLAAVTRHEGVLFLGVWLVALWWQRRPLRVWVWLVWAPLLYNAVSWAFLHEVPALRFLDARPTDEYGAGTWLTMLTRWPIAAGIGPLLLAWIGLPGALRRPGGRLWVGAALTYFMAQTVIYRFGLFGSGGYERFLVPLGPVVAVAAAEALSEIWTKPSRRHLWVALAGILLLWIAAEAEFAHCWPAVVRHHAEWARVALRSGTGLLAAICAAALASSLSRRQGWRHVATGLVPATLLLVAFAQPLVAAHLPPSIRHCGPLKLTDRQRAYQAAIDWLRAQGLEHRPYVAASPWLDEFLGRTRAPQATSAGDEVAAMQPGGILLWDSREAASPRHGLALDELRRRDDFVELWRSGGDVDDPVYCAVFEKQTPR
jgi:hypothetical protein